MVVADREADGRIDELRLYYRSRPLTGRHATRPPLLQPDPELRMPDVVAEYQRALETGDLEAIAAAFESGDYAREPYERMFSNGGGITLEHCNLVDDGRACALEYNVTRWGTAELSPQAGVAVYVRGRSGRLAAARTYHDADPALRGQLPAA